MIVTYRVNPMTAAIAKRLVQVKFASILNLLAGRAVIPELIQWTCTPEHLAATLLPLLIDPAAARRQREEIRPYLDMLRPASGEKPSEAAASAILELLDQA